MEDVVSLADIIRMQWWVERNPEPKFVGLEMAQCLRKEHGFTDHDFCGLNIKVSNAVPCGKAYVFLPSEKYGPPRPPIWIGLKGIALRNSVIAINTCLV